MYFCHLPPRLSSCFLDIKPRLLQISPKHTRHLLLYQHEHYTPFLFQKVHGRCSHTWLKAVSRPPDGPCEDSIVWQMALRGSHFSSRLVWSPALELFKADWWASSRCKSLDGGLFRKDKQCSASWHPVYLEHSAVSMESGEEKARWCICAWS